MAEYYGTLPIIYTSVGFWNANVLPWTGWKNHPLWIAFWSTTASFPLIPEAWKVDGKVPTGVPVMWQWRVFKGGGPYFGVSSADVDMDTTYPSFGALLGEPVPPPPPPDMVTLTINIDGQGSVTPGSGQYPKDSQVSLQATPAQGWQFEEWVLSDSETEANPLVLTLHQDTGIWAMFGEIGGGIAEYTHNRGKVMITGLRIRSGPGTVHSIIGSLPKDAVVEILGTAKDASGNTWARIGYNQWACMVYGAQIYIRYILEGELGS
jgi:hypothetical protein